MITCKLCQVLMAQNFNEFTCFVSSVEINFAVMKFVLSCQGSAFPWRCCSQVHNKPYGCRSAQTTNQNESEQQILLVWDHVLFPML